jgi:A/G-specific adenine glycosylase
LAELCLARRQGLAQQLPLARIRKAVPVRRQVAMLVEQGGACLARPRPAEGFLGGLWELPVVDLRSDEAPLAAASRLATELGLTGQPALAGQLKHAYSHFTLELALVRLTVVGEYRLAEGPWQWLPPALLRQTPLHGAHRKALAQFLALAATGTADG